MEKIYKQPFTSRSWSLTSPSVASMLLYRLTGGSHGEEKTINLDEKEMIMYSTGAPRPSVPTFKPLNDLPSKHINCRCAMKS